MSNRAKTLLLFIVDMSILFVALTLVVYSRKDNQDVDKLLAQNYSLFAFIVPIWILMYFIEGLYTLKTYNPANLPISILRSTFLSVFASLVLFYFIPKSFFLVTQNTTLILSAIISIPLLHNWRKFFFHYFGSKNQQRGTLLIGSISTLELAVEELIRKPHLGYHLVGTLTPEEAVNFEPKAETRLVAIERNLKNSPELYKKYFSLLGSGIEVMDLAKFTEQISGKIPLQSIDESWFIEYCGHLESRSYDIFKGLIDRLVAVLLIILIFPIYLLLMPLLLIVHGRPIFFKQTRTGLNNKPFVLYKLRSMVIDAEKAGAQWAKPGDARITPVGHFLRKTRLDELPQLINIFKGEMSLVGPRPERPEMIDSKLAPNIPFYNLRHLVKPGVTGWAQVTFRYGFSQEDSAEKLQFDLFYVKNKSLWLDILITIKTIKTVLTGAGQ
ncbi:MAG: sugar transferase [Bdellovibrionales bacterium]|nr:sugar transferase [Bdellovibrionales bacterium]